MILRLGYHMEFYLPGPATIVTSLNVHPSRTADLREPDELRVEPATEVETFIDSFGNRCTRFVAPAGLLRLSNSTSINDSGLPDAVNTSARELPVNELPHDALRYLYNSRTARLTAFR